MNLVKLILLILMAFHLGSCSSFFSGSEPLPINSADRGAVKNSVIQLERVPKVVDISKEETTKVYVFAFDGTENDRENFDDNNERETTVGYLASRLEAYRIDVEYIVGPGVDSMFDSAFCYSCLEKASDSLNLLKKKLARDVTLNSNTDVKVVVLGFSRGAAIGRHFMNLISNTWPDDSRYMVRSYGLLFDTVATSVTNELMLGIAPTSDYLIHFIARDERREKLFPVVIDNDLAFKAEKLSNLVTTPRLTQLELPGVHSDIGASYKSGIGTFYRYLGEFALANYGLIPQSKRDFSEDFFSQGVHDSRGWFSRFTGAESYLDNPNTERRTVIKDSIPISNSRAESIVARNKKNTPDYSYSYFQHTETNTILFNVKKVDNDLEVLSAYTTNIVDFEDLAFEVVNGDKYITFKYNIYPETQTFHLDRSIWKAIPENTPSTVELVLLKNDNGSNLFVLVNGVKIVKY